MDSYYRPTWAEISLDALHHNLIRFQEFLPHQMEIMAVIKANAYGHGAVEVAKQAISSGAGYLAVAFLDEALELRSAGITAPILVLGYIPSDAIHLAIEHNITLTVFQDEMIDALSKIKKDKPVKVHIKIDTGMGRLGVRYENDAIPFIKKVLKLDDVIEIEGIYTHFANADEEDKTYTLDQYKHFKSIVDYFEDKNIHFSKIHTGNSATAIDLPDCSYNMVRLGISMYGIYPSAEVDHQQIDLKPVMSLKTKVVMSKVLPPHSGISYGTKYFTKDDEQIATLPIGYADGYSRMLTGKADVLIRGRRVPVIGTICMDQCMINVTELEDVKSGEEVVLFGKQGNEQIPVEELAEQLDTINYEIVCMLSHRVPKVYVKHGEIVMVHNGLHL
ncbi:alanine racemase [Chengkuizengella axinellae]|uniref:Alanine racemase n=1 Tax=Chengkuizengella axinellae TaxID=3064388 RepID=A0ABT9J3Y1_9BACL|nr:alanine racemase [Chengkuizengella sp. 2205SS18-9]MDP5276322.1 alanine racemase [Chengkuizengella sp. 2205SS18-9]